MAKKGGMKRGPAKRRPRKAKPGTRGLTPAETRLESLTGDAKAAGERVESVGGHVLGSYNDPLGKQPVLVAILPIESVEPTPFQRDLSQVHHRKLADVLDRTGMFLDPIIAVTAPEKGFWTPNGMHRLMAMRRLGARAITALVVPKREIAWQILALNTEKAHNLREKALEVIRIYRGLLEEDASRARVGLFLLPRGSLARHAGHLLREERQVRRRRLQPDRAPPGPRSPMKPSTRQFASTKSMRAC